MYAILHHRMKMESPSDSDLREVGKEQDWTVGAVSEDIELSEEELDELEDEVIRYKNGEGGRDSLLTRIEQDPGTETARNFRIDLDLLQTILYEYRRYSQARGFSDAEMDILRAIEFEPEKRVGVDEIMANGFASDYSESMVYKALGTLQEKGLIDKIRPGVYQYIGP